MPCAGSTESTTSIGSATAEPLQSSTFAREIPAAFDISLALLEAGAGLTHQPGYRPDLCHVERLAETGEIDDGAKGSRDPKATDHGYLAPTDDHFAHRDSAGEVSPGAGVAHDAQLLMDGRGIERSPDPRR